MKRLFLRAGVLAGVLSLYLAATAGAAVLLGEDFTYDDGSLTTKSAAGAHPWVTHSGVADQTQVVGGEVILLQATQSEDLNTGLSSTRGATDVTWASFKFKVSSGASLNAGDYFCHFRYSGNFIYPGRVQLASSGGGGGDYRIGIQATSSGPAIAFFPTELNYDTYYTGVAKFDANSGDCTIYINPTADTDPSATSAGAGSAAVGAQVDQYALRQGSGNLATVAYDDLIVGESFADVVPAGAPGASAAGMALLASLMLGAGALFVVRRRATVA